ncbi:SMI1/KNR4 family protein [Streptomyces griseorubiginosus]|uniref:SMI1/KNR4 family protein n=1 Tax=Streptomyces griseorubiginosus TaxID=67304 RepID=UPI0036CE3BA4
MSYREKLRTLSGTPLHRKNPEVWVAIERSLGVGLPNDYKDFIDGYGPVRVNGHLHFDHPSHPVWDLAKWIAETVETYAALDWVDLSCPEFASEDPRFGAPNGLIPLFESDRGECFFFKPGAKPRMYVYVGADDDIYRYDVGFAEWLYRYLQGEDMAGPNSSAYYPGPVRFDALPHTEAPRGQFWFGPERSEPTPQ